MLEFNAACLERKRRKWGKGTRQGEQEAGVGSRATDGSIDGDIGPLICPPRDDECDSVRAHV